MNYGYARVSTTDQKLDSQIDQLKSSGAETIITEKISGTRKNRPGLEQLKSSLKSGDKVIVFRLDRLGRSLQDLLDLMNFFEDKGVAFVSIHESINTGTSTGKLIFHIFAALAEFERNLIRDRIMEGLKSARERGKIGGSKKILSNNKIKEVKQKHKKGESISKIARDYNVSRATIYNYIAVSYTHLTLPTIYSV